MVFMPVDTSYHESANMADCQPQAGRTNIPESALDSFMQKRQYSRTAMDTVDPLNLTFGALAEPTRRAMLARLAPYARAV
jgi:hypothetical protein